jgi:hypothetical protein
MFAAWWESLSGLGQFFALVAIPATVILILQTLMLLFGLTGHGDVDAGGNDLDHDHDFGLDHGHDVAHDHPLDSRELHDVHDHGLRIFTVRAFVAFFTIFGWLGVVLTDNNVSSVLSIALSVAAGFAAMVGMAYF